MGAEDVYLLTTTAAGFFARFGFLPMDRTNVPAAVRATTQFTSTCSPTAAVMVRHVRRGAIWLAKE